MGKGLSPKAGPLFRVLGRHDRQDEQINALLTKLENAQERRTSGQSAAWQVGAAMNLNQASDCALELNLRGDRGDMIRLESVIRVVILWALELH